MSSESSHRQITSAVSDGWVAGSSVFGSILSGTLLGLLADNWLGTDPWLVITGICIGSYSGFMRVLDYAKRAEGRQ